MKTCSCENCQKRYYAKGFCKKHYTRFLKTGCTKRTKGCHSKTRNYITHDIELQIATRLIETNESYQEIGARFGMSRGPVDKIVKEYRIKRDDIRKRGTLCICSQCIGFFYVSKAADNHGRGKFCSKKCYTRWQKSEENRGVNNPSYVDGGNESEMNKLRKTDEWKQWREQVYERDSYTCQICGQFGGFLHPHHILKKSIYPELVFEVRNGITLCADCHMASGIHNSKLGWLNLYKKINEAQYMHMR